MCSLKICFVFVARNGVNSTRGELQRVAVKTHFSVYFVHYFLFVDARNGVNSTRGELQRVVVKPGIQSCTGSVGVERFRVLALSALAVDLNISGFANSQQSRNSRNGWIVVVVFHTGCFFIVVVVPL